LRDQASGRVVVEDVVLEVRACAGPGRPARRGSAARACPGSGDGSRIASPWPARRASTARPSSVSAAGGNAVARLLRIVLREGRARASSDARHERADALCDLPSGCHGRTIPEPRETGYWPQVQ
jgi:hypothetical protein